MLLEEEEILDKKLEILLQQGIVGEEIENLLQDLSKVLLELMNLPGNILSIPQKQSF